MNIEYIDKPEQLDDLCKRIQGQSWIALDTEFLREKTYYPIFCLLQIATPEWVVCVDPIALPELSELFEAINNPKITKVLHACRQDLEIFYQITGKVSYPVFDTQIAAPLLGFQENPGYAMLVSSFLNVNLSKAYTRTDWSIRPLSQAQIQYAADDVIYLCKIYSIMCEQLEEMGRLNWLENDFELLTDTELYQLSPINAWLKIKGKNNLTGKQLSIVQVLAQWREQTAQQENRPKNWLIRDDLLLQLAKLKPDTVADLIKVRGMSERTVRRYGKTICQLIEEAKNKLPIAVNNKSKSAKKTQAQEAVLDLLTAIVRIRADENSINPAILASRKNLEKLLFEEYGNSLLCGWRYSMVGQELQGVMKGQYKVTVDKGSVVLSDHHFKV
ncbi:MAG: ribonuclease D [Methylococcales symbiont of Hymedesmia sp. n. MRB-2018]|nr:MAG: ribonuclease D [Methylococcales symbiont of Hymedesmia sp. n. MRB-2018]KAF3983630.1 MAG: ribonuclease D [Methylococcales symbiont of Hymedesmia sp. n. MRB-2018]